MVPAGWAGEVEALLLLDPPPRHFKDEGAGAVKPLGGRVSEGRATERASEAIRGEFSVCRSPGENRDEGAGAVEPVMKIKVE